MLLTGELRHDDGTEGGGEAAGDEDEDQTVDDRDDEPVILDSVEQEIDERDSQVIREVEELEDVLDDLLNRDSGGRSGSDQVLQDIIIAASGGQ